ncbi:MAG: hypothetical protein GY951_14315, partial [Psychromonas sp.]|nr:hypothetical protein [Psychromonas sp.]
MRSALIFDSEIKADADHRVISDNLDAAVKVTSNGIESDRVKAKINITFPDKTQSQFVALDNGEAVDAKKSDAIYTAKQVIEYQQLGLHVIESDVDISYLGETYTLKNMKNIWVTENLASIESVEIITDSAQQGCIQEVKLIADIDIKKAGHYKLLGMLEGSKNRYYGSSHELFDGQVGFQQIEIKYPKKDLLSSFSKEDVISFVPLRVLKMDHENQYNTGYNAYVNRLTPIENRFKLADLNFCREDIEVAKDFVIEEEKLLGKTKISALQL